MEIKLNKIVELATTQYLKYGIKSITMDDMAKALCISKKTIYQYVENKNELVEKVIAFLLDRFTNLDCEKEDSLNAIEKHVLIYNHIKENILKNQNSFEYDLEKYYPKLFKKFIDYKYTYLFERTKVHINQGIKEGFFKDFLDVDKTVFIILLKLDSLKTSKLFEKYKYTINDIIDEFFMHHIYAIATTKGVEEYTKLTENK